MLKPPARQPSPSRLSISVIPGTGAPGKLSHFQPPVITRSPGSSQVTVASPAVPDAIWTVWRCSSIAPSSSPPTGNASSNARSICLIAWFLAIFLVFFLLTEVVATGSAATAVPAKAATRARTPTTSAGLGRERFKRVIQPLPFAQNPASTLLSRRGALPLLPGTLSQIRRIVNLGGESATQKSTQRSPDSGSPEPGCPWGGASSPPGSGSAGAPPPPASPELFSSSSSKQNSHTWLGWSMTP